jgi:hypothetical protein
VGFPRKDSIISRAGTNDMQPATVVERNNSETTVTINPRWAINRFEMLIPYQGRAVAIAFSQT